MINKYFKRINLLVNRTALRHVTYPFSIMLNLKKYRQRKAIAEAMTLDSREEEIVAQLREVGFANVTDFYQGADLEELLEDADKKVDQMMESKGNNHKTFWTRPLESELDENGRLPGSSLYVRFAKNKRVLKVISRYFGMWPSLHYALLTRGVKHHGDQKNWKISQLWHKDFDGIDVLKLFVYLSDVEEPCDGPFTLLNKKQTRSVGDKLFHRHMTDEILGVPEEQWNKVYAKKKTVFIVNTTHVYHMGGRQLSDNLRLLYTAAFSKAPSHYITFQSNITPSEPFEENDELLLNTY